MNKQTVKRIYNVVVIAALVAALAYVCSRFWHPGRIEWTDDAQVYRHITPINTRVQGFIKEIRFEDYQHVHRGDTLVILEDAEYRLQLAQAEAGVRGSRAGSAAVSAGINTTSSNVNVASAGTHVASAGIDEARVAMENAKKDFDRYAALLKKDAVTAQQYDNAKARYDDAVSRYEAARARYAQATAATQATAVVKNEQSHRLNQSTAGVSVAEAQLNLARLNLSYTVIVATADGYMGRKDIHVGQLVQPGQLLARIVDDGEVWVNANYRETQMKHIAPGAEVTFTADAVPDVTYHGKVERISSATGAATSGAHVDNATGNFVKVEQRVPVRIVLTADNRPEDVKRLLAGLNVITEVKY
ncbi:MAG: HlyD family secretion protein [Muribaculaceae bacterium]|nr:HlyD family secretion protein [Muribaculaceae bacterium]MBR1475306.1 HlyD family secretion protein [Muribaculaceae bacterium]